MIQYMPAEQRDLPLLFQLNQELIEEYEDLNAIDCERVLTWVQQNLKNQLPFFRRIECNGVTAGFFCLSDRELDSLFVLPQFRGRGIGTDVVRFCQQQSPSLMLYVFRKNTRAIALYRKLGFIVTKDVSPTRAIMEWKNQDL